MATNSNINGMVNNEPSNGEKDDNSNGKISLAYGLAIIFILFLAIILSASFMGVFNGYEPYQQLTAAMLSVAATGVITAMLLYFQRKQQEQLNKEQRVFQEKQEKDQNEFQVKLIQDQQRFEEEQKNKDKQRLQETKIFEERLRIYQEFLTKLCDVVKDQAITPEEEIELQFQVSYIAMHTSPSSIKTISDNVKKIILSVKKGEDDANNMLGHLFEISDVFHKELYKEEHSVFSDSDREETIGNFKSILIGKEDIQEYEDDEKKKIIQVLEEKEKAGQNLNLVERLKLIKAKVSSNGADFSDLLYRGKLLNYEYYTKKHPNGKYIKSNDTIAIDLFTEGDEFVIRLGTRRNDPEKTKEIAIAIDGEFRPGDTDVTASHWHVHTRKVLSTSNDEIMSIMNELLAKVKAYRDKEYPLK